MEDNSYPSSSLHESSSELDRLLFQQHSNKSIPLFDSSIAKFAHFVEKTQTLNETLQNEKKYLDDLEKQLYQKEVDLEQKEQELQHREGELEQQEKTLTEETKVFDQKKTNLEEREKLIVHKEQDLETQKNCFITLQNKTKKKRKLYKHLSSDCEGQKTKIQATFSERSKRLVQTQGIELYLELYLLEKTNKHFDPEKQQELFVQLSVLDPLVVISIFDHLLMSYTENEQQVLYQKAVDFIEDFFQLCANDPLNFDHLLHMFFNAVQPRTTLHKVVFEFFHIKKNCQFVLTR